MCRADGGVGLVHVRDIKRDNVFHHHVGQPITSVKKAWQHQLTLRLFNFIAIKQGTYVRRARI
jgi:hypothetical protein